MPGEIKKAYAQCRLEMRLDNSVETLVAWIPSSLAEDGKRVVFKQYPLEEWTIAEVYAEATERDLLEMETSREWFCYATGHPDSEIFLSCRS